MATGDGLLDVNIVPVKDLNQGNFDGILLIASPEQVSKIEEFSDVISAALDLDNGLENEVGILPITKYKARRLIYSPTGPIDDDYDDVRCFRRAATYGIRRAVRAGVKTPLVYILGHPKYQNAALVTLLGVLEGLYVPIQLRELDPHKIHSIKTLGVFSKPPNDTENLVNLAMMLENGRRVACDIGDADPERMSPPKVEDYINELFSGTKISVSVVKSIKELTSEYPLFEAVNRAASNIERHQGRIMFLEYKPDGEVTETLFLVGKGVTYDTGGADIKAGGVMAGMSRDKCGAAAVVGFLQMVNLLKPKNLRVVGGVSLVRNSVGSNAYVADELIKARSGSLVRVRNTDAEGRMIMADVLCKFKEMALTAVNPHLYTIATLTGHACLAAGDGYSIVLDNGPARKAMHAQKLQEKGESISDPFEISTIRRDDLKFHRGKGLGDDIDQANNEPSVRTARGHQGPAGFLILASGLDKHGSSDKIPLKYSHLDIAASSGHLPDPATGAPVLALANTYLL